MDGGGNIINQPLFCAVKRRVECRASCQMAVTVYGEGHNELWFCGLNAAASAIHFQKDEQLGINYMHTGDPAECLEKEVAILQKHQFCRNIPSITTVSRW